MAPDGWTEVARVSEPGIWRDLRVVRLAVVPRPAPGVLVERVAVELVYQGTGPNPLVRRPGSFSPGLTEAQKALVLNHESVSAPQGAPGRSGARYLVLCSNTLQAPAQTLADWRHLQGLQAAVYTLSAMGAPGIPNAGAVTLIIVLAAVDLPAAGIGTILAIDWLVDRERTVVNVFGDAVGAAVIDRYLRRNADKPLAA